MSTVLQILNVSLFGRKISLPLCSAYFLVVMQFKDETQEINTKDFMGKYRKQLQCTIHQFNFLTLKLNILNTINL